jgi:hypothetical protein
MLAPVPTQLKAWPQTAGWTHIKSRKIALAPKDEISVLPNATPLVPLGRLIGWRGGHRERGDMPVLRRQHLADARLVEGEIKGCHDLRL